MEQDGQQQMPRSQSRASPMGVSGAFALLAAEADIAAAVAQGEAGYHEVEQRTDMELETDMLL